MNVSHNESSGPTHPPAPPADPPRRNANDDFRLETYRGEDGDWYHRIISVHNGNVVLDEGYRNRSHLVDLLQRIMPELEIHEGQAPE